MKSKRPFMKLELSQRYDQHTFIQYFKFIIMKKLLQVSLLLVATVSFGQTPIYNFNFDSSLCSGSTCFSARNGNNAGTSSYGNDRFDMFRKSIRIENPNFLEANLPNLPSGTTSRTFSFWMANNAVTGSQTQIFSNGLFGLTQTDFNTTFYGNGNTLVVPFSVLQGVWNFYTVTFDGTAVKIYINGTLRAQNSNASTWFNSSNNFLSFGRSYVTSATLSNISLDELKIYDVALTDSQIANLYVEDPFSTANLVAYYGFENNNNSHNGQNNLQNVTGVSTYATGVIGNALDLKTTTASNALFSETLGSFLTSNPTSYTVCFWMKRDASQSTPFPTSIELFGSHYLRDGTVVNTLASGYASNATTFDGGGNTPALNFNNYIHVAIVHKLGTSDDCRVYIDGVDRYFATVSALNVHRFNPKIFIGGGANGAGVEQSNKRFIGQIDEIYVYNRALTLPEVRAVKNNTAVSLFTNKEFKTNNLNFSLYPNPANSMLNIDIESEIKSVEIYSLLGQKVLSDNKKQINISNLSTGVYMLKVEDVNGAIATQKFVKE